MNTYISSRDRASLSPLFNPTSVAVIGASNDPKRIGGRPLFYLSRAKFSGPIYPVNPNRKTVQGLPAFPNIRSLPEPVDLAIIALPASLVIEALQECADHGVLAAVIFTSGFAELGPEGAEVQARITEISRTTGMRILGPNCLGTFNSSTGFYATFTAAIQERSVTPGPLAIVSQSGACGGHLAYLCAQRGIGIRHWVTTGNEADVDLSESLLWMAQSPDVKVIAVYAEAVRDGETFVKALKLAQANKKPIVMLKVGRSKAGARAAASHTGALAGDDAIYDAILDQYGVWRAQSIEEMLDITYGCVAGVLPAARTIGLVSVSGGIGVQMADAAAEHELDVSPMPLGAQAKMKKLIPFCGPSNPIDVTAQVVNDLSLLSKCLELVLREGSYASVLIFLSSGPAKAEVRDALLEILREFPKRYPDRLIGLCMVAPIETLHAFEDVGFLTFEDTDRAIRTVSALSWFSESFERASQASKLTEAPTSGTVLPDVFDEHSAKSVLESAGLSIWPEVLVATPRDVRASIQQFDTPVVVKIASPDITHKTEVKGVALGITSGDQAEEVAFEMLERIRRERPDAQLSGFLVSPMCTDMIETICGSFRDPIFGPMVMFGLGGVFVEVLEDVVFRQAPFGPEEAMRMIDSIRSRKILDGVRGASPVDVVALANTLSALSKFAFEHRADIREIDINPLAVNENGAFALDALIVRDSIASSGTVVEV